MIQIDEDALTIFIPAWGTLHLDYLRKFALPSVLQSGNLPACGYSKIYVEGSTINATEPLPEILQSAFASLPAEVTISSYSLHEMALLTGLKNVIRKCIERRTRMLLVMPDTIFANFGICNMRDYARGKPVSVAAPHLRVMTDSFSQELTGYFNISATIPSSDLVRMAMTHAHQSLLDSFSDRDNGTLTGGISMTRVDERLATIIHYLPTVYLAWFTESDAAFFNGVKFFGAWDHDWHNHLAHEGRFRVFGSSALFFAAELTDPAANRIKVEPGSRLEEHSTEGPDFMRCFVGAIHG